MRRTRRALLVTLLAGAALGCDSTAAVPGPAPRPAVASAAPARFLKGQLHAHTGRSMDSATDPAEAAVWYAARGYDFVVFTDHNVVTDAPAPLGMLLLPGVELTQNLPTCDPPPERGDICLLHVNALFVTPPCLPVLFMPRPGARRIDLYGDAVDRARAMGGVAQLNHPNFQHGADVEVLVALAGRGLSLVEIANEAVDSDNEGDARHPSTEAMWDAALARGAHVFGTASDDAHHYDDAARVRARGEVAYTGDRGFVMVRAAKTPEAIRAAVVAGDFYASTGVVLERVALSHEAIAVDARGGGAYTFEVIAGGRVVATERGAALRVDPRAFGGPVRVRVTDAAGRHAWTQPVWP